MTNIVNYIDRTSTNSSNGLVRGVSYIYKGLHCFDYLPVKEAEHLKKGDTLTENQINTLTKEHYKGDVTPVKRKLQDGVEIITIYPTSIKYKKDGVEMFSKSLNDVYILDTPIFNT